GLHRAVVIGAVLHDSAAEKAGFKVGDQVLALNGEPVKEWPQWQQHIMDNPEVPLQATVLRDGQTLTLTFTPSLVSRNGKQFGQLGVALGGLYQRDYGPVEATGEAFHRFAEQTSVVWASLVKLVTGKLSLDNLGGPITIAQVAGESAAIGMASFLSLLAYLSITLGVINLLPVPILDGGWIFFGIIEMIRGRSLSERFLIAAQGIGLTLVISFMLLAIYNDLVKQFS
ncbi:MAG: RIP metalloprotease RseP, partial [Alcanivorax sp.]|nr:RIP metalloprotease RseP [Alcanivorax sp.]